jgi:uncharacterized membrane protein
MSSLMSYADLIVFFHILGAIIWIGGMIAIKIAVHPVIHTLSDQKERVQKALEISGKLFKLVATFIIIILATGLIIAIATNGHHTNVGYLFVTKEIIWSVMTGNYLFMIFRLKRAKTEFENNNFQEASRLASIIPHILLPINIALGIIALYVGVKLRGF